MTGTAIIRPLVWGKGAAALGEVCAARDGLQIYSVVKTPSGKFEAMRNTHFGVDTRKYPDEAAARKACEMDRETRILSNIYLSWHPSEPRRGIAKANMIQIIKSEYPHLSIDRGAYWGRRWVIQMGWWILLIGKAR